MTSAAWCNTTMRACTAPKLSPHFVHGHSGLPAAMCLGDWLWHSHSTSQTQARSHLLQEAAVERDDRPNVVARGAQLQDALRQALAIMRGQRPARTPSRSEIRRVLVCIWPSMHPAALSRRAGASCCAAKQQGLGMQHVAHEQRSQSLCDMSLGQIHVGGPPTPCAGADQHRRAAAQRHIQRDALLAGMSHFIRLPHCWQEATVVETL